MAEPSTDLVPIQRRIIEWKDGLPVLASVPVLNPGHIRDLYWVTAAQPYVVDDPLDPEFGLYDGMTIAEVMVRKQFMSAARSGDKDQIEKVMDRLIGKPKNTSENVNLNLTGNYEEFLKRKAAEIAAAVPIQEAEVVSPDSARDVDFGDLG